MNNLISFLKHVDESFDELTEFENGKPQPKKDPIFGLWLNSLTNEAGNPLDLNDLEINKYIDIIIEKRQTLEGIKELKILIKERLSNNNS
jgi:hypothetical protein